MLNKFGEAPPACPASLASDGVLRFPSVCFEYVSTAIIASTFTLIVSLKYDKFTVFNHRINSTNTSNTYWIGYFLSIALLSIFDSIRFGLSAHDEKPIDTAFVSLSLVFYGTSALMLCWALNYQVRYRSSFSRERERSNIQEQQREVDPLVRRWHALQQRIGFWEVLFLCLFVVYLICTALVLASPSSRVFFTLWEISYSLQRVPIIILVAMIVIRPNAAYFGLNLPDDNEGPSRFSKLYLVLAALCGSVDLIPSAQWNEWLPHSCTFYIGSILDGIELLYIASFFFFFLFTRSEYFRNLEAELWTGYQTVRYSTVPIEDSGEWN